MKKSKINYDDFFIYADYEIGLSVTKLKYGAKYVYLVCSYSCCFENKDTLAKKSFAEQVISLFNLRLQPKGGNSLAGFEEANHIKDVDYAYNLYEELKNEQ